MLPVHWISQRSHSDSVHSQSTGSDSDPPYHDAVENLEGENPPSAKTSSATDAPPTSPTSSDHVTISSPDEVMEQLLHHHLQALENQHLLESSALGDSGHTEEDYHGLSSTISTGQGMGRDDGGIRDEPMSKVLFSESDQMQSKVSNQTLEEGGQAQDKPLNKDEQVQEKYNPTSDHTPEASDQTQADDRTQNKNEQPGDQTEDRSDAVEEIGEQEPERSRETVEEPKPKPPTEGEQLPSILHSQLTYGMHAQ